MTGAQNNESPKQMKQSGVAVPGTVPVRAGSRSTRKAKRAESTRRISDRRLRTEHKRHPGNILMAGLKLSPDEIFGIDLFRKSVVRASVAGSDYGFYDLDDRIGTLSSPIGAGLDASEYTAQQPAEEKVRTARERLQVISLARHGESYEGGSTFPDVVTASGGIELLGALTRRHGRKLLEEVSAPLTRNLFGFAGWSIPYWDLTGDYPSVVLLEKPSYMMLFLRDDGTSWARLTTSDVDMMMPVSDESIKAYLEDRPDGTIEGRDIELVTGKRPYYLLTTLQPPYKGNCYKTISAIITT